MMPSLSSPVQYAKGIGPKRAEVLSQAGIRTFEDLLYHFPRRYEDRSHFQPIKDVEIGAYVTIKGEILSQKSRRSFKRRGFGIFEISVADDTGRIFAVWFNQTYLDRYFKAGGQVILYGKAELYQDKIQLSNPDFEILDGKDVSLDIGRIVPVYSLPQGFSQRVFRKLVKSCLDTQLRNLKESLPFDIRSKHHLLNIAQSFLNIHFPDQAFLRMQAYQRLSFEEFFLYQIPLILRKLKRRDKKGIAFSIPQNELESFLQTLPFLLTGSQRSVLEEIKKDMGSAVPMQRLLQGDVGCGKTIVALLSAVIAVSAGYQAVLLVPTEILAGQHYGKILDLLAGWSRPSSVVCHQNQMRVGLLTSSLEEEGKKDILKKMKSGELDMVIGTHALLQDNVSFARLGLIIIDEQHKFGVSQRALLPQKGVNPDVLIMTATPIPRTLSLTLYGDLDISVIHEMPKGRGKIKTQLFSLENRADVYEWVKRSVRQGRQAYLVYPLVEENERLELSAAKTMYKEFKNGVFKDFKVGLVHGKMKRQDQEKTMSGFRQGQVQILVATTVLEVGIDVANATVIVIEHAERFGLAQLHQMRGRIGRGEHESHCLLLSDAKSEEAQARLNAFVQTTDGFKIAEEDLKLRGPGEFFGERQHGLAELKIADPLTQMHVLKAAREDAHHFLEKDALLADPKNAELKRQLYRRFPEFEKFIEVG